MDRRAGKQSCILDQVTDIKTFWTWADLHFLPEMSDGEHLDALRRRFVLLAHGTGRWEAPHEAWMVADLLGSKGIPNRVDEWGVEWDHDWVTWRRMLPHYLDELG